MNVGGAHNSLWRNRLRRIGLGLIIGLVALRIAMAVLLPVVLKKTAAAYDLRLSCERIDLSLLGGDAGIWGVQLAPLEHRKAAGTGTAPPTAAAEPLIKSEYVRVRISPLALFIGRLHIFRVECDGAEMLLERLADGRIPLLDHFTSAAAAPAKAANKTGTIDLTSPLRLDALRVEHLRMRVRDQAVVPNLEAQIGMELRINDLGSRSRAARLEFTAQSDPLVDRLAVLIEGTSRQRNLDATVRVDLQGLRPGGFPGHLAARGFSPDAREISGHLGMTLHTEPLPKPAAGVSAKLTLDNVELTDDSRESFGLDHLILDGRSIDRNSADFSGLTIEGLRFHGSRNGSGLLR